MDGGTAVARVNVWYGGPVTQEYRDLWIMRFAPDGRWAASGGWPFWPERSYRADPQMDGEPPAHQA